VVYRIVISPELIDNISLLDSGNSYSFTNGKLVISYDKRAVSAEVPLTIDPSDSQRAHIGKRFLLGTISFFHIEGPLFEFFLDYAQSFAEAIR